MRMAKLISSLNVGDKVRMGKHQVNNEAKQDIIWQVAGKNHNGYPSNSVTLVAEKIIDLRGFDAKEPNNSNSSRQSYGNNRYRDSNLRQWLNKSGKGWFSKTHSADEAPNDSGMSQPTGYDTREGFLSAFTNDELKAILDTTLTVAKNTETDGGGSEQVTDKVFLLSNTEVGLSNENGIAEGSRLALFSDNDSRKCVLTSQAYNNTKSGSKPSTVNDTWYWWLRSPYASYSHYVRYVYTGGSLNSLSAYNGSRGVRPALNLKSGILVSDTPDSNGVYTLIHNNLPTISGVDENLGDKNKDFDITYQVNDADSGDVLTVIERIDDTVKRTIKPAQRGQNYKLEVDISLLGLGVHTASIELSDGKATVHRTYTFRKTNTPPTISGKDENLGDKNLGFQITYQVDDADGDEVTVKEKLNGEIIRTLTNAPKNSDLVIDISDEKIRELPLQSSNTITIEASDPKGGVAFRTYTFRRVNTPPLISGQDEDLGVISGPFTKEYMVTDAESDDVVVKELLDGRELKSYQVTLGQSNTTVFTQGEWVKLTNGVHTFKIQATDIAGTTTTRTFTFEKKETKIALKLAEPFETDAMASKVFITPTWDKEHAESVKVEACNNALDVKPTWEDITEQVLGGRHYNFINESKTAAKWGVDVKIEMVKKQGAEGVIEITGFGGAFE